MHNRERTQTNLLSHAAQSTRSSFNPLWPIDLIKPCKSNRSNLLQQHITYMQKIQTKNYARWLWYHCMSLEGRWLWYSMAFVFLWNLDVTLSQTWPEYALFLKTKQGMLCLCRKEIAFYTTYHMATCPLALYTCRVQEENIKIACLWVVMMPWITVPFQNTGMDLRGILKWLLELLPRDHATTCVF